MPNGAKIDFQNVAATNWVGGELVLKFTTTTGSHGFTLPGPAIADALVVAGGGAGGSGGVNQLNRGAGGGGGAGGLIETNDMILADGAYTVSVGKGGQPGEAGSGSVGGNGDDSTIVLKSTDVSRAYGGGGGGSQSDGNDGGSGGGGSKYYEANSTGKWGPRDGGGAVAGQGNKGGDHPASKATEFGRTAAGGGGAGGVGGNVTKANVGAPGGLGKASTIWNGSALYYAGGGGGGTAAAAAADIGKGGSGVGGDGAGGTSGTGSPATPGAENTGSGGGGGSFNSPGAAGGSGVVIVRISAAMDGPLVKPTDVTVDYDGSPHLLVKKTMAYTVWQNGVPVDKVEATFVGTYTATVKLNPGFEWSTGGDDDVEVTLQINQAKTVISNLSMPSWTEKEPPLPEPTCTINVPGVSAEFAYAERRDQGSGISEEGSGIGDQDVEWSKVKPTKPGDYWVKASVLKTDNWTSAEATAEFSIYEKPADIFEDHVEITLEPYAPQAGDPTELTNFPYKVKLSPTNPMGFDYTRADALGHELCFADKDGNALGYEIEGEWNPGGESILYVAIPLIRSGESVTLTLYWKVRDGKTAPAYDPTHVFDNWTKGRANALVEKTHLNSTYGMVETNGEKVDYWVDLPELTKTSWGVTTDPSKTGHVKTNGSLRSGRSITYAVYNAETGAVLAPPQQMPMDEGVYYVLFSNKTVTAGYRDPAPQRIDIRVIASAPYDNLGGTLGGRIMLANADKKPGHEIPWNDGQAYWQLEKVRYGGEDLYFNPYWTHEGDYEPDTFYLPNLLANGNHDLNYVDAQNKTNVIWRFRDIRIGNTYMTSGTKDNGKCYLPHSTTALGISKYSQRTKEGLVSEIGHLVMRNLKGAVVYSPCYTNGIGTIYFDAVNAYTEDAAAGKYKLAVEIATQTKGGEEPTDENAGEDLENLVWTRCNVTVLRCVDGAFATDVTVTNEVTLANLKSATDTNFYRLCVKLNKPGNIRFRIIRTEAVSTVYCGADYGRFILLDNILVSFPTDEATVEPFGVYDPTKTGKQTLGWEGTLANAAFPSYAADALYARAKAVTNATSVAGGDPSTFIQLSKFHYQWHYLDQATNVEQSVDLRLQDGFVATEPLKIPKEVGDVSFWLETYTKIPFYDYVDYSGKDLNLGVDAKGDPLYTEEVGMTYYPANARDGGRCFFRLREGESDWAGITVSLSGSGFGADEPMELISDHMWRGLVRIPTNVQGLVNFEFHGVARWEAGGTAPVEEGVIWYPTAAVTNHLPARGQASVTGAPKPFRADGATGYMEFQFNDETKMFSLGHAEYQNFNVWHDARTTNETFVGTYVETSGVTVASMVSTNAHMATWETLRVTDDNWDENFYLSNYETDAYKKNVTFSLHKMPHQWNGENGMFVDRDLTADDAKTRQTDSGIAWQMQGFGIGSMSFTQRDVPNGLDTVLFEARLQQGITFEDFSYCYADGMMATNNYTFLIPAIMSTASSKGLADDFAPGASMSIIGYYQPFVGCYEFRVSRDDNKNLRFTIYKWARQGYRFVGTPIGTHLFSNASFWHGNGTSKAKLYGMFISLGEETAGKTTIIAGLTQSAYDPADPYAGNTSGSERWYRAIRCEDGSSPFTAGSIGVLTASCKGRFLTARRYPGNLKSSDLQGTASAPTADDYARTGGSGNSPMKNYYGQTCFVRFPGSFDQLKDRAAMKDSWAQTPGRIEWFEETTYVPAAGGFRPPEDLNQTVGLYVKSSDTGTDSSEDAAWTLIASKRVASYGWQTYGITVRTNQSCHVMLKSGDAPTDVTIGLARQSGWNGADMENPPDNDFIFTQAKVSTNMVLTVGGKTVTNKYCTLQPARAQATKPVSIRGPILRHGLGMVGFKFTNLCEGCEIWVQTSTNEVTSHISGSRGLNQSLLEGKGPGEWFTERKYTYAELAKAGGEVQHSFGLHDVLGHPVVGVIRILIAPHVVEEAAGRTMRDPNYGAITITDIWVEDEPALDTTSWLGWNIRILGDAKDTERRMYLPDPNTDVKGRTGLSSALNNSTTEGIPEDRDPSEYSHVNPTIQSPTFKAGSIGYVRFRARVYDNSGIVGQPAKVTLYGTMDSAQDAWGKPLETFDVDSLRFKEFNYRAGSDRFAAIRLAVDGVVMNGTATGKTMVRVLLDEVIVSEKAESTIGFEYARPFRSDLDTNVPIEEAKVLGMSEQPLTDESWGVQAKLKLDPFDEDLDLSRGLRVTMRTFKGLSPWGSKNWGGLAGEEVDLTRMAEPDDLVFRSTAGNPRSIVAATREPNTVVQYELKVHYYIKGESEEQSKPIAVTDTVGEGWTNPTWYWPEDKNAGQPDKVPYTILDGLSPGRAWINEVNYNDGPKKETGGVKSVTNQFIEIAVPWGVDMTGWKIVLTDMNYPEQMPDQRVKIKIAQFGTEGLKAKKSTGEKSGDYGFVVLQSPGTKAKGGIHDEDGKAVADATWSSASLPSTFPNGELQYNMPYQLELVRPSGVVEHQFVLMGTNEYREIPEWMPSGGYRYEGTNLLAALDIVDPSVKRFFAGEEISRRVKEGRVTLTSLGVTGSAHGEEGGWSSTMKFTPGHLNEGQDELSGWFLRPNGSTIWVYAKVDEASRGNVVQHAGEGDSQDTFVLVASGGNTNITYDVSPWFAAQVTAVTESGRTNKSATVTGQGTKFSLNNVTETLWVVAREDFDPRLLRAGLDPNDRYAKAVQRWMRDRSRADAPDRFKNPDGPLTNAIYRGLSAGSTNCVIGLKGQYWFDVDPTEPGWWLRGGFVEMGLVNRQRKTGDPETFIPYSDPQIGVKLYWSNEVTQVVYAPYRLQGLNNEKSDEIGSLSNWTSETFKVEAELGNKMEYNLGYLPFRWFVFGPDSFVKPTESAEVGRPAYTTKIEILDPFSTESPGYSYGWHNYKGDPIYLRWNITDQMSLSGVEMLKADSTYENSPLFKGSAE